MPRVGFNLIFGADAGCLLLYQTGRALYLHTAPLSGLECGGVEPINVTPRGIVLGQGTMSAFYSGNFILFWSCVYVSETSTLCVGIG
jgi:hypothetical protein